MSKKESSKRLKKNVGGSSVIGGAITIGEGVLKSSGSIVSSGLNEADEAGYTGLQMIEGIGPMYSEKLRAAGITSIESLLKHGATSVKRKEISSTTGINPELILAWVNRADIFRIKGVAEDYSALLEAAGVDTVIELAHRKAENLYLRMVEVNERKRLVHKLPTFKQVENWITQAKSLPRVVIY